MIRFFQHLSITQRIAVSFSAILVIGFFVIGINYLSLNQFRSSFLSYKQNSLDTNLMLEIDEGVSELHRYILIYSETGSLSALSQLDGLYQALLKDTNTLSKTVSNKDQQTQQLVAKLQNSVIYFKEKLDSLESQYQYRDNLVNHELIESFSNTHTAMSQFINDSVGQRHEESVTRLWFAQKNIAKAEVLSARYFSSHEYALKQDALASIENADKVINKEAANRKSDLIKSDLKSWRDLLRKVKQQFVSAIQADRDFLFLVNIVIAGESAELIALSESLKKNLLAKQNALAQETDKEIAFNQKVMLFSVLVSVLLAAIIAILTGNVIARSIKSITHTLSLLAQGEAVTEIPGEARQDEVGSLARAAKVFNQKNLYTKELLIQAEKNTMFLQERERDLEAKNNALSNFTHVVSHDLKTPLRGIADLAAFIIEDLGSNMPEEVEHNLERMQLRVKRVETLISDLLTYSEQGKVSEVDGELVLPSALIGEAIDLQVIPDGFNIQVIGDSAPMHVAKTPLQVSVRNLIANAIAHHDKATGYIEVKHYNEGKYCVFEVADDGPGIPKATQERIFILFQTLDEKKQSSGLGLAFAKRMVEAHGGYISVESDPEVRRGSTFRIFWPVA